MTATLLTTRIVKIAAIAMLAAMASVGCAGGRGGAAASVLAAEDTAAAVPKPVLRQVGRAWDCGAAPETVTCAPENDGTLRVSGKGPMADYGAARDDLPAWCIDTGFVTGAVIEDGVTRVGDYAFYGCKGMTSLKISNSVTDIGTAAFYDCEGLEAVTMPDGLTSIGAGAFAGCKRLSFVDIPNSVTSVGDAAFSRCSGLGSVVIGDGVAVIRKWTFANCRALTQVKIGSGVRDIESDAFRDSPARTLMKIPSGVERVGHTVFYFNGYYNLRAIGSWIIGNTRITLHDDMTLRITGAWDMTEPGGRIKTVLRSNYYTAVFIENSFRSMSGAMLDNPHVRTVVIPANMTEIGERAFANCPGLTSVSVAANNAAYYSENGVLFNKNRTTLIHYPLGIRGAYNIPGGVEEIGGAAFRGHAGLTSLIIPGSVEKIGNHAFSGCTNLTSVTIGGGVASIGGGTFFNCARLASITVPGSVKIIGRRAFDGCDSLTSIDGEGAELVLKRLGPTDYNDDWTLPTRRSLTHVGHIIQRNRAAIRQIYNNRLKEKQNLQGEIRVKLAIDERGEVIRAQTAKTTMNDPVFERAVIAAIKNIKFGEIDNPGDVTEVTYPFRFLP